jgi:hypothetical protein
MSVCNGLPTKALRSVAVLAGVLMVAAGCVPVQPGYDGYGGGYVAAPAYAPGPVYAPDYGYGGGVVVYGGSGGGYYDRGHDRREYRGGRPGGYRNDGNRGGGYHPGNNRPGGGAPPQAARPRGGLFPGLPAGPQHQARPSSAPSGGNHGGGSHGNDRRERRP